MKMIQGVLFRAVAKRSRTLDGPTPTNISTNSDPDTEKKGTPDSPAVAFASKVLPVPGGPERIAPLGILAPSFWNLPGSFKKDTNSMISTFASSIPATSANLVLTSLSWLNLFARDFPMPKMPLEPPPADPARLERYMMPARNRIVGPNDMSAAARGTSSA